MINSMREEVFSANNMTPGQCALAPVMTFFYLILLVFFSMKICVVGTHWNCLTEAILLSTQRTVDSRYCDFTYLE